MLLSLLAACAAPAEPPKTAEYSTDSARKTLAVGFQQISERYIEYLPVGALAFEGLRGLNVIDPTFEARKDGATLAFGVGGKLAHSLPVPGDTDALGWAVATLAALNQVAPESPALAGASIERIYEAVFDGSLTLLDPYSRYAGATQATHNREKRSGFGGIGIEVRTAPRGATISEVYIESPAASLGLRRGDLITHVDARPLAGSPRLDISALLRGPVGSPIELRVERDAVVRFDLALRRQRVVTPTVYVADHNGIVTARIKGFNRRTTHHLEMLLGEAIGGLNGTARGVVLDLRGNPGGLLSEAVKVADLFVANGRILSTHGRHPASLHDYDARADDVAAGLPMVVVVNGRSASASEIVAAALQDHDRAIVVGTSSYGKGTVQTVVPLPNRGELTLTWSRFVTPSGYILNGLGVSPSICTNVSDMTAVQMIRAAVGNATKLAETFEAWRRQAGADRKALKSLCPPSDALTDVDIEIAETVIADHDLYNRILGFSPALTVAGK